MSGLKVSPRGSLINMLKEKGKVLLILVFLLLFSYCSKISEIEIHVSPKPLIDFSVYKSISIVKPEDCSLLKDKAYITNTLKDYFRLSTSLKVEEDSEINYKNLKLFINDPNFWIEYGRGKLIAIITFNFNINSLSELKEKRSFLKKKREIVNTYLYKAKGKFYLISGIDGKTVFSYTFNFKEKLLNRDDDYVAKLFFNIFLERAFSKIMGKGYVGKRYIFEK